MIDYVGKVITFGAEAGHGELRVKWQGNEPPSMHVMLPFDCTARAPESAEALWLCLGKMAKIASIIRSLRSNVETILVLHKADITDTGEGHMARLSCQIGCVE